MHSPIRLFLFCQPHEPLFTHSGDTYVHIGTMIRSMITLLGMNRIKHWKGTKERRHLSPHGHDHFQDDHLLGMNRMQYWKG